MAIVDASGQRVKLACLNWYGFHLVDHVINGLDRQPADDIIRSVVDMGFNCIRLVYSMDTLYLNPVIDPNRLTANPELQGMTSMEVHTLY